MISAAQSQRWLVIRTSSPAPGTVTATWRLYTSYKFTDIDGTQP